MTSSVTRDRLAGEHEAGVDLVLLEREVAAHRDLAVDDACARHVPQTPPLQANGRSGRTRWAASRTVVVAALRHGGGAPVEHDGDLAAGPVDRRGASRGAPAAAAVLDVEQLPVDRARAARPAGRARWRASVTIPNGPHSHQWSTSATGSSSGQQRREPRGVEAAAEQLRLARLPGRARGPARTGRGSASFRSASSSANITVSLRRLPYSSVTRARPCSRSTDAAIDSIGVMPDPAAISTWCARRPEVGREGARRRLHVDHVARPDLAHQPAATSAPPGTSRTPMRGGRAGRRADRVRPPLLAPVDEAAQRQRLAGPERVHVAQLVGHVEGHRDGVVAEFLDVGDAQGVKTATAA